MPHIIPFLFLLPLIIFKLIIFSKLIFITLIINLLCQLVCVATGYPGKTLFMGLSMRIFQDETSFGWWTEYSTLLAPVWRSIALSTEGMHRKRAEEGILVRFRPA